MFGSIVNGSSISCLELIDRSYCFRQHDVLADAHTNTFVMGLDNFSFVFPLLLLFLLLLLLLLFFLLLFLFCLVWIGAGSIYPHVE